MAITKQMLSSPLHFVVALLLIINVVVHEVSAKPPGAFVWISDAHLDEYYSTNNAEVHQAGAPCRLGDDAPQLSAYGCGTSLPLLNATIAAAATKSADLGYPEPDFVLFTGDYTRHNKGDLPSNASTIAAHAMEVMYELLDEHFPNVPVVRMPAMDLGNNDFLGDYYLNVTSTDACLVVQDELPTPTNAYLASVALRNRKEFISDAEAAVFACGGYLSRKVLPDLAIISLNTIIWSMNHEPSFNGTDQDAFGQFEWLEAQLIDARQNQYNVYITGHIPAMLQSYTGNLGAPLWQSQYVDRYNELISDYTDVIAAQLFGHVHSNELRVVPSSPDDAPPMLISSSIAPCYTTSPSFNVVYFDKGGTNYPIDLVTYNLNLDVHNATLLTDISLNADLFDRVFENLTSYFGMNALTNHEVAVLSERMVQDTATFDAYFDVWYKGTPQNCYSDKCRRQESCLLPCGFSNDAWQSCLEGGDDAICTVGMKDTVSRSVKSRPGNKSLPWAVLALMIVLIR